jgi:hypothetical protein
MTARIGRRALLAQLGLGGAGAWLGSRATPSLGLSAADRPALDSLADTFRRTPRDRVLDAAAQAIASGATREVVFGGVFLAGLHDIRPQPVGNALHSVMMVESALVLTDGAAAREAWLAALWTLDDFKDGQGRDAGRADWELGPAPASRLGKTEALRELEQGLEAFAPERAERAVVALLAHAGAEACFQAVWPYAARSLRDAGHRILHAAQVERAVRRLGPGAAEAGLRSLVLGLARDADGPHTAAFARSRGMAVTLPASWLAGAEAPERSLDVLRALRGRTPEACQDAVRDAFRAGWGPQTVWDGLRLYAAELMLLRPDRRNLFPVHTLTEMESLGHVFSRARDDRARRLIALQAGAWVATVRDAVVRNNGAYAEGPGIDAPAGGTQETLAEAVDARAPARVWAALERAPDEQAYLARLRSDLVPRADQNHQYKLAAAVIEESRRVHPRWRARILATAVDYLPAASEPPSEVHSRSLAALRRAGVPGA